MDEGRPRDAAGPRAHPAPGRTAASVRRVLWQLGVLLSFAAIAYAGFVLVEMTRGSLRPPPLTRTDTIIMMVALIVTGHVVLALHEIGHVIGGWIVGYRFRHFIVGPLRVARENGGLRIGPNTDLRRYAGSVGMEPGRSGHTRLRTAVLHAAGPAASLLAGAIITLIVLGEPVRHADFGGFLVHRQLEVLGPGSIIVGLANLVPVSFSGGRSDGARLVDLLTGARS